MAVLHKKEEKIQAVLGRLPKKYSHEEFVAMFISLYSRDWGRIKAAYVKQSQDKEPGTVIHMPKPELYLKQVLEIFLSEKAVSQSTVETGVETVENEKAVKKKTVSPRKAETLTKEEVAEKAVDAVKEEKIIKKKTVAPRNAKTSEGLTDEATTKVSKKKTTIATTDETSTKTKAQKK